MESENLAGRVSKLEHTVFGNGMPGLAEGYRTLKAMVEDIKTSLQEGKEVRKQIVIGVSIGVIISLANLVITLIH